MKKLAKITLKILTLTLMFLMILAIAPSLVNAQTTDWQAQPMHHIKQQATSGTVVYWPSDIKTAYNLPSDGGAGTTIAIVDAYNNPNLASDLAYFSTYNNLPTPSLTIHKMSSRISNDYNWGMEEALDVQWAHAIAPEAKILLVEARSASLNDLLSAVIYAKSQPGVVSVSMSWGGNEFSSETSYDSYFTSTTGVQFFAASGDTGGAIIWPSSSANVISVGGTTLTNTNGQWSETAWSGSGGGVSSYEPVSSGQAIANLGYKHRATPDVSFNADPNTGFAVYDTFMPTKGWYVVGGTSAGAPQWAAIQALGKSATSTNLYSLYASTTSYSADFRDVTIGQSGGYSAGTGYDLTTGIGSPLTTNFAAPPQPDFTISANPPTLTIPYGSQGTSTITIASVGGFSDTVQLTATGITGVSIDPSSITGFETATLTIPAGTAAGSYQVMITGTDNSNPAITHPITINVQVTSPTDYSLSASSTNLNIQTGRSGTDRITISPINGYTGKVTLSATSDTPTGVTYSFSTNPVTITSQATASTLTITVPRFTQTGTYTITIQGTDGTTTHTTAITLKIPR